MYWTEQQITKAKEDFRIFVFIVWRSIGLPEPTEIQYDIAETLMNTPNDRFIIEGFRGVAKSFLTCAYVVWKLWKDPQLKVLVVSASKDRADANAIFIKRIILLIDFLDILRPQKGQRDTQNLFDVGLAIPDISPSVKSVGITGQITGSRADLLIADDVEIPNNSSTQTQRMQLQERVKEFDAVLKPKGQIIYLGTPQNEMSLYNELTKRGYKKRIWTVQYPSTKKERENYGDELAPLIAERYDNAPQAYAGQPTDPTRFNTEEIAKRKLSYGKAGFALQFMLNTNLSDAEKYPLKIKDLIVTDIDNTKGSLKYSWCSERSHRLIDIPCVALKGDYFYSPLGMAEETEEYTGCVMAIDPSGRGKDETAYAIIKFLNGFLFLVEVGGYRQGYTTETLTALALKAKYYGVNEIITESNFGDGMFVQLLKPIINKIHACSISEVNSRQQKERRIIDTLEPVLMQHRLIVNTQVIMDDFRVYEQDPAYSLIYQMTRLCNEKGALAHDDRLDALAMAVAHWKEVIDRDAETGLQENLDALLEAWADPDIGIFNNQEEQQIRHKHIRNMNDYR